MGALILRSKEECANLVLIPPTKASGNGGNEHQQKQQQQNHNCMGSTSGLSSQNHYPDVNNYHNHSDNNWAWCNLYCNFLGCNSIATHNYLCSTHWTLLASLLARGNVRRGRIQGGDNQNDATIDMIQEVEKKEKISLVAGRKQKADVSKQQSETSTSNDTGEGSEVMNEDDTGNKGAVKHVRNVGVVNPERDESDTTRPPKKTMGEGGLKDDRKEDASDEEKLPPREFREGTEIQALTAELSESNKDIVELKKQLKAMSSELDDARSQSEELEAELAAEKKKKAEIDAILMELTTARLEERVANDAANAMLRKVTKKLEEALAMLNDTEAQLKIKADAVLELKGKVGELEEQNASLRNQLDQQPKREIAVKEEELTDDEEMIARLNK
jgi:hypothetical protein